MDEDVLRCDASRQSPRVGDQNVIGLPLDVNSAQTGIISMENGVIDGFPIAAQ